MDDGTERRATEVCRDYLALLQCMVPDFESYGRKLVTG
jgi:hypothetical protein